MMKSLSIGSYNGAVEGSEAPNAVGFSSSILHSKRKPFTSRENSYLYERNRLKLIQMKYLGQKILFSTQLFPHKFFIGTINTWKDLPENIIKIVLPVFVIGLRSCWNTAFIKFYCN